MNKKAMRTLLAWALAAVLLFTAMPVWAEENGAGPEASAETVQHVTKEGEGPAPEKKDAPKPEAPKPEAPKPEAPKPEAPKPEAPKPEAPNPDAPKPEAPKPDAPQQDAPQQEKQDVPQQDAPQQEKQDIPQQDVPQQEKQDIPQQDVPQQEKQDAPKQDAPQQNEENQQDGQLRKAPPAPQGEPAQQTPASVPATQLKPALNGGVTMVVKTGNSGGLNLREQPSTASPSLGLFPNGTLVKVHGIQYGWALVTVNGMTGYMVSGYLAGYTQPNPPQPNPPQPNPPQPYPHYPSLNGAIKYMIRTGNSGRLHLRQYPSTGAASLGLYPNGTILRGVDQGNGWVFVSVNGVLGYMMRRFLTTDLHILPDPVIPDPIHPTLDGAVIKVVRTGNSGRLHLREGASTASRSLGLFSNGTVVEAKNLGNGWSYVRVSGRLGYMASRYLADPGSLPPVPVDPDPAPLPGTAKVYHRNGSFVNLRSSKASRDDSNVIARIPHGTTVTVLQWGTTYTKVQYNGMTGYIITSYLRR